MADRTPASFVQYQNTGLIRPGKIVTDVTVDDIRDDLHFALDAPRVELAVANARVGTTNTSWVELRTHLIAPKNLCNSSSVASSYDDGNDDIEATWLVRAYASDGTTAGEIRCVSDASADATGIITVTAGTTSATWFTDTFKIKTNSTEDSLTISYRRTAGSGTLYLLSYGIWSNLTNA